MKPRIEQLLEKYWEAETSLEEEKELRQLLNESPGYEKEKTLFGILADFKKTEPETLSPPKDPKIRNIRSGWMSWAASVALLMGAAWGWHTYDQRQAEKKAYEEVMQAMAIIQSNLAKGQEQLQPLNELKHLNTTHQLFQKEN